jgi:myxalamid-type nonribosomal peptide synthetase MxaA
MHDLAARIAGLSDAQRTRLRQRLNLSGPAPATGIDWEAEIRLEPSISPGPALPATEPGAVLVTGATGFLGAYLVHELARQTSADIYCLVRAATPEEALDKLRRNQARYGLPEDRVIPVPGDLAKPRLGLPEEGFRQLASEIDAVYHNGALVNFVYPYEALKPANVQGTREVLRFACTGRTKPVHYVSTVSVFGDRASRPDGFREDEAPPPAAALVGGYARSKRVAEHLISAAGARGLPVSLYRPSFVTGDSRTGTWNTDDFLGRIIGACLELGLAPEEDLALDTVPVDYVGRALVHLSRRPESAGKTFHLTNPVPLSSGRLIEWVNAFGLPVERVPFDAWLKALRTLAGSSPDHRLSPLIAIFEQEGQPSEQDGAPQRFDCSETRKALAGTGIVCPAPDEALWRRYLACFARSGLSGGSGRG